MKLIKYLVALLLFSSCISDKNEKGEQDRDLKILNAVSSFSSEYQLPSKKYTIILPNQGCIGCITVAEQFLMDHYQDDRCLFILSSIVSIKSLKNRLEEKLLNSANVVLDTENILGSKINQFIYPIVIIEENNKKKIIFQKPGEFALERLLSELN